MGKHPVKWENRNKKSPEKLKNPKKSIKIEKSGKIEKKNPGYIEKIRKNLGEIRGKSKKSRKIEKIRESLGKFFEVVKFSA